MLADGSVHPRELIPDRKSAGIVAGIPYEHLYCPPAWSNAERQKQSTDGAPLREVLKRGGFGNVRSYVQSGNVLVDSMLSAQEIEKCVRELIKKHIGPDLAVVVRTGYRVTKGARSRTPFSKVTQSHGSFLSYLRKYRPRRKSRTPLRTLAMKNLLLPGPETQHICSFQAPVAGASSATIFSKRSLAFLQPSRNFNTMSRLVAMSIP